MTKSKRPAIADGQQLAESPPVLPQPKYELMLAVNLGELAKHQRQRLTRPLVRILFEAIVSAASIADHRRRAQSAARGLPRSASWERCRNIASPSSPNLSFWSSRNRSWMDRGS